MTDSTRFEDRLTVALGKVRRPCAGRCRPDPAGARSRQGNDGAPTRPRVAVNRLRLSLAFLSSAAWHSRVSASSGADPRAGSSGPVSPSPSTSAAHHGPDIGDSARRRSAPTASLAPTAAAVLRWTEQDIGAASHDEHLARWATGSSPSGPRAHSRTTTHTSAARFIRSRDGRRGRTSPARRAAWSRDRDRRRRCPLGRRQARHGSADPRRGIWTTRDGATWQRVAGVKGLDFGPGRVDVISLTRNGWLALARRWINAEAQDGFMLTLDRWRPMVKAAYPEVEGQWGIVGLVSDGNRWLLAIQNGTMGDKHRWRLSPLRMVSPGRHISSTTLDQGGPVRLTTSGDDSPGAHSGFVIVGTRPEGEFPHPLGWHSSDGETWTSAATEALPDLRASRGCNSWPRSKAATWQRAPAPGGGELLDFRRRDGLDPGRRPIRRAVVPRAGACRQRRHVPVAGGEEGERAVHLVGTARLGARPPCGPVTYECRSCSARSWSRIRLIRPASATLGPA